MFETSEKYPQFVLMLSIPAVIGALSVIWNIP